MRGSWSPNRIATYWPPLLWPLQRFFPVLLSCSTGGPGAKPFWDMFLISASSLQLQLLNRGPGFLNRILSPTDWTSCAPSHIKVRPPPSSCGRHKSHSFHPSTVKVIFWLSSTGFTCYLHRCISYFDSPAGSGVNIQHYFYIYIYICVCVCVDMRVWFFLCVCHVYFNLNMWLYSTI